MARSIAEDFIKCTETATAVVRYCTVKGCKHIDLRRKPFPGSAPRGRGNGFVEGNKQRGRMIEHVKTAHAAELAARVQQAKSD